MGFESMKRAPSGAEKKKQERSSEKEAHLEANMLKAELRSKLGYEKAFTAEDYEVASLELEELKKLADKDPEGFQKLLQYSGRSLIGVAGALAIPGMLAQEALIKVGVLNPNETMGIGKGFGSALKAHADAIKNLFEKDSEVTWNEAQRKLRALRNEAERLGEDESAN